MLATAGRALGSLDAIESLLKLKLTLAGELNDEARSGIGEAASDTVTDLLGSGRGARKLTVTGAAARSTDVVMETEAILRVRETYY